MNGAFLDYYRCPESLATFGLSGELSNSNGFFHFGSNTICYGRTRVGHSAKSVTDELYDLSEQVTADGDRPLLVDGTVGTEGRDHRRKQAFVGAHAA